jgi:hypothetical protein
MSLEHVNMPWDLILCIMSHFVCPDILLIILEMGIVASQGIY